MDTGLIRDTLRQHKWHDPYLCRLAALDHIRECLEKDNHLKACDIPKDDILYAALEKELMDLKIILELYFHDRDDLYATRLSRFMEKLTADTL